MTTADERVDRLYGEKIRNGGRFVVLKRLVSKRENFVLYALFNFEPVK